MATRQRALPSQVDREFVADLFALVRFWGESKAETIESDEQLDALADELNG